LRSGDPVLALGGDIVHERRMETPRKAMTSGSERGDGMAWMLAGSILLTLVAFFGLVPKFAAGNAQATLPWLTNSWNNENKLYEHGWMVVPVMGWFLWKASVEMRKEPVTQGMAGLWWLAAGVFLWVGAFRGIQARAAVLSLPFLVMGAAHFSLGWRAARHLFFPLSFVLFMIPVPGLEQRTNDLAILSTKLAHHVGNLIGIPTIQSGTQLLDPDGGSFKVDDGCSGIRSIVALLLISYIYAMVAHRRWGERAVIFAAALPLAIPANAVRIVSILVVAKFDRTFAMNTWHNYSGFFSFGAALAFLLVISAVMRGGLRALRPKVKVTRVGGDETGGQP
jgi:exosortase